MKILMVTMKMDIGGAETHILELCRELGKMGHTVTLVSNGGVHADMLVSEGIDHVKLPLDRKTPHAVASSLKGLEKLITEGNYDLVHAHARIPAFICGILWKKHRFRFVTTAHLNFSINPLWRRLSCWGERSMAVSDDIGEYLVQEYGYPADKISVTINGIDTVKYSADVPYDDFLAEFHLPTGDERNRLVYVSRLDEDRADPAYRIVNIAEKLDEAIPDLDIIIGGGGTEFDKINRMAEEVNKKAGRRLVTMTDNRSDINKIMSCADVFVGVSRSALEAMAASKPVIIAGNQGALGIFDESVIAPAMDTNFCCRGYPQADEGALFRDITALFGESKEQRRARGEWCRSVVMKYYTAERMARDYVSMYERTLRSPIPFRGEADVVISGYYGFGNMGDETLLDTIAQSLSEEIPGVKISALTRKPKRDRMKKGINCIGRTDIIGIIRALKGAKLLISGGGTLFQDGTSKRSLWYYAGIIRLAKKMGTKVYVYANGIGPIMDEKNRRITAEVVGGADCVTVRDPDSKDELITLGVDGEKVKVTADPAFLTGGYTGEKLEKAMQKRGLSAKTPFFAVSLRRCEGKLAQLIDEERLVEETAAACAEIGEKFGLCPVLIPMQPQNDEEICRRTVERINERLGRDFACIAEPETAPELVGILSQARFVVGMRLHMLIFSGCARVPVIGLSYDPKIDSIMKRLEQPYILSVRTLESGEIVCCAEDIMRHHDEITDTVSRHVTEMAAMCHADVHRASELLG
ncbi:MAG: polysaccharide pyruvyl transferase CsaB [Ruminococcaceae bacterium]|nr:polysaccharide pyruvyl transferase CsaB [Oscillospiraceae bacterium]